jgi:hypothetical protein
MIWKSSEVASTAMVGEYPLSCLEDVTQFLEFNEDEAMNPASKC